MVYGLNFALKLENKETTCCVLCNLALLGQHVWDDTEVCGLIVQGIGQENILNKVVSTQGSLTDDTESAQCRLSPKVMTCNNYICFPSPASMRFCCPYPKLLGCIICKLHPILIQMQDVAYEGQWQ